MADSYTDISKTHLNQAEQVIKLNFYLRLQNAENFALSDLFRVIKFMKIKEYFYLNQSFNFESKSSATKSINTQFI